MRWCTLPETRRNRIRHTTLPISMTKNFHSADDITIHTENSAADESIFVYRDSFGINLHPFLAQSYGNACFSRNMPYLLTAVTEEHPDVLLVELVERNLNWLLERAPEMPAPERTAVPAADTGTSAKAQRKDSRMEGTFCLTGDLSGQRVDDDSPDLHSGRDRNLRSLPPAERKHSRLRRIFRRMCGSSN